MLDVRPATGSDRPALEALIAEDPEDGDRRLVDPNRWYCGGDSDLDVS